MSQIIALTALEEDGRAFSAPRVRYIPASSIEFVGDNENFSTLKFQEVKQGVRTIAKILKVLESGRELEAAIDPNDTHPAINGIVDVALSPLGSIQGGAAVVAPYLTEIASASVTPTTVDAIQLPAALANDVKVIYNPSDSGGAVDVFPDTGETIDGQAVNLSISIAAGGKVHLVCTVDGAWVSATDNG